MKSFNSSQLNLTLPYLEASPGKNFSLGIRTNPDSVVSLSAVDQRLLTFESGNDITLEYIFLEELSKYNYIPFDEHFDNNGPLWYAYDSHERKFFVSILMA